jgi:hypothetical protein
MGLIVYLLFVIAAVVPVFIVIIIKVLRLTNCLYLLLGHIAQDIIGTHTHLREVIVSRYSNYVSRVDLDCNGTVVRPRSKPREVLICTGMEARGTGVVGVVIYLATRH